MITREEPGGFLPPVLPSTVSSPSTTTLLPHPRSNPLKPGSAKETNFIDYVDQKLLGISRRYEKRFNANLEDEPSSDLEGRGYEDFGEVARDLEALADVIWISGTRWFHTLMDYVLTANSAFLASLQKPYFLTIALAVCSYMPSFSFSPVHTFKLLQKLDLAFSSLLRGVDILTGAMLAGFETGRARLSTTEKVRMKGLVERTRVAVVEVAGKGGSTVESASETKSQADTEDESMADDSETLEALLDGGHGRWEMEVARVYERTIVELGVSLETSGVDGFE